jgi:hypothetical protein
MRGEKQIMKLKLFVPVRVNPYPHLGGLKLPHTEATSTVFSQVFFGEPPRTEAVCLGNTHCRVFHYGRDVSIAPSGCGTSDTNTPRCCCFFTKLPVNGTELRKSATFHSVARNREREG